MCLGFCGLALFFRFLVRYACFRRLLPEDYLMVLALALLVARSVLLELHLGDIYALGRVEDASAVPGADFLGQLFRSTTTYGVAIVLDTLGFWVVKLNFLLFFYRLAHQIRSYLVFWWATLGVTLACGVVALALLPYECMFSTDLAVLVGHCAQFDTISDFYTRYIICVVMDVVTNLLSEFLSSWRRRNECTFLG